jgi:hopanoid biosynthesis associated protein HpnK
VRRLVVTADDFGLSPEVNEAVEMGHRRGILTSASLMVSAPAARDAVERARRLPRLRVGLHLAVVDATPSLPPREVPGLLGPEGRLPTNLPAAGVRFFFLSGVRRELAREIRAQFEAFRSTGLTLDHVNAHHHMHLHPTVAELIVRVGRDFGLKAVRVPAEPEEILARAGGSPQGMMGRRFVRVWASLLRVRLRRAGLICNDHVFGLAWTGSVTEERVLRLIPHLPDGLSELFCHPATTANGATPPGFRPAEELRGLTSPLVSRRLAEHEIRLVGFGDLAAPRP